MTSHPITSPLDEGARNTTGAILQGTLTELINLTLLAKQAHWNVVGPNFRSVHLHLDELVALSRRHTDEVAERATAIGVSPNGKAGTVAEMSRLPDFPDGWTSDVDTIERMATLLAEMIKRVRQRIDETDKADLVTQDLLIGLAQDLEQQHWMWQAQQVR